jgi:hypothetical protein
MNQADEAIYKAINEAQLLRDRTRKRKGTPQVRGSERDIIRATALTWFHNHRPQLMVVFADGDLADVDRLYQQVIAASHKSVSRSKYVSLLRSIRDLMVELRSRNVVKLSAAPSTTTTDQAPDFSSLIRDERMKAILGRRWFECTACLAANAPLAATVMMGGLLEGLLLARVHSEPNQAPVFTASAAPKDAQGKTLQLKEWTLHNYIDVAHELRWISQTVKDVGEVLRDYRNYIHPQKELSHGISLSTSDASLLWEISKSIARQVLKGRP